MFERFTNPARQVAVDAYDEARELRHQSIGTEHLLLGLLRAPEGIAAAALSEASVTAELLRAQLTAGAGERVRSGQMPFTPEAKGALEAAVREADAMNHAWVGTEHVLLGLLHDERIAELQVPAAKLRERVVSLLSGE